MRPIASIKVTDRVRDTFGDLRELIDSMRDRGLINPVTIQADGTLIAGERRWRSARELGWTEIACHVWQDETAEEILAVEIEENTCRAPLTLVEAERAWQKYRELLGTQERDENGRFVAEPPDAPGASGGYARSTQAAQAVGYGRPTMERIEEIRETAEDESEPEEIREVAKEELAKLSTATRGAVPALERVRLAKKQATQAAMSPGQRLRSDEPKAPPKTISWHDRLWDVVGTGRQIRSTAEELELDPDTSALSADDIKTMAELLMDQIKDRQYLRKVLLSIKEGRK
jgi:hypothetical protein